jgi:phosphoribosylamine--glycine ligase
MARILIVGGGAREHALAFALRDHELVIAPGNAGTSALGENVPGASAGDVDGLVALAVSERVELAVVGPEQPLVLGVVDALEARGIRAFGPSRAAARLEGSKAFMKGFLKRHGIPTAAFAVFDDPERAKAHARAAGRPLVVKADGLCAGKGVVVPSSVDETLAAIDRVMVARALGDAGAVVVLEELLGGEEASFHAVCDGTRAIALVAAQDHKRVFDGDRGPNTGGMGAYAPAPVVTKDVQEEVMRAVVEPTLRGMASEGAPFKGALFVGLMIEAGRPRVLEFNVRFGDPETTVLVPMIEGDWFELLDGAARGDLGRAASRVRTRDGAAVSVVMAAEGYPGKPRTGDRIEGLDAPLAPGAFVFHAGTKREGDAIVTAGGRVLAVGAAGASFEEAHRAAYGAVARVRWPGEHHRTDIGHRALARRG